jgi:hypothetical protein
MLVVAGLNQSVYGIFANIDGGGLRGLQRKRQQQKHSPRLIHLY